MSDEWVERTLGEATTVIGGGTPSTKTSAYWGGDIPWLTPTEVVARDGTRISTSDRTITELGLEKSGAKLLPQGTVLVTSRASVGYVALADTTLTTNQGFQSLVAGDDLLPEFLMLWVQANRDEFRRRASGSTFPEVSKKKVEAVPIRYPALPSQRRIVDLLTHVDAHIANLQAERDRLNDAYCVRSEAVFSSLDAESWTRLGEVSEVAMGPFGSSIKVDTFVSDGVPVIIGRNLEDFYVSDRDFRFISDEHAARLSRALVSAGDIVITHRGTLGQVSLVPESSAYDRYCISQSHFRVSCDSSLLDPEFCTEYLRSRQGQTDLLSAKGGTGIPAITRATTHAKQLKVPMPPLDQQLRTVGELRAFRAAIHDVDVESTSLLSLRASLLEAVLEQKRVIGHEYDRFLSKAG